jgi:hypothetical protein
MFCFWAYSYIIKCRKYALLHIRMGPISKRVCTRQAFPAESNVTAHLYVMKGSVYSTRGRLDNTSFSFERTNGPNQLEYVTGSPFQSNVMFSGAAKTRLKFHSKIGSWRYPQTID